MSKFDFIIIGQGLAGSILAYSLIQRNHNVLVIDNDHHNSSSKVAAGIINPITGHRLNITEGFESYFTVAEKLYLELEKELRCKIYCSVPQHRMIKNQGQLDYYKQRITEPQYQLLLSKQRVQSSYFRPNDFGSVAISQTSVLDTKLCLETIKQWLIKQNAYLEKSIKYEEIKTTDSEVIVGNIKASKIIFCEGYQAINNPWLDHLPFKLSKGDILTLQADTKVDTLLNWGYWLAPTIGKQTVKLGSNFVWNDQNLKPDQKHANKFLQDLGNKTTIRSKLISHEVGIRPTTTQRRPFIGKITKLDHAYCFNGFGSKGCLLIPFYAELLCEHLNDRAALPIEITKWL